MQSQTKGSRRVKVERGQNWIVRFLPARMGPDGLWFARIARHWMGKVPIVCPRNTAEDFGGNPDCECPVCVVADELNDSADEIISKFGYKAKANPQYLTYCVVWEKDGIQQPLSEILNPYEFMHYRSTFEELKGFYLAGGRKCPDSVLDYEKGNDFSVSRTGKGTRLDKLDASPIFEADDPKYAEYIKRLESACKTPKLVIPTDDQLQVFAHKVQAAADRGGEVDDDGPRRGRGDRGGGRGRYDDEESNFRRGRGRAPEQEEDDVPYDYPPSRSAGRAAAAPARRSAPEQEDDRGQEESPRRRAAPADQDAPPSRRREEDPEPRRRAPADEEPARRRPATAEDEPPRRRAAEQEPEPQEDLPPRRAAPAPARRPAATQEREPEPEDNGQGGEPEETPPPGRRQLEPTARRAASGGAPQGEPEEEDPLPEDDKDTAPPAPKRGTATAADEDAPPPVARRGSQGADIKDRLARMPRGA